MFGGLNTYPLSQERPSPIMNTSAKTNLGHLEASAGMAGAAKLSRPCWQDVIVQKRPRRSQMCQHSEEQYLPIQQPSQKLACNQISCSFAYTIISQFSWLFRYVAEDCWIRIWIPTAIRSLAVMMNQRKFQTTLAAPQFSLASKVYFANELSDYGVKSGRIQSEFENIKIHQAPSPPCCPGISGVSSFGFGGTNARGDLWGRCSRLRRVSNAGHPPDV